MPIASIRLQPGLDVEQTPTYNSASFSEIQFGRFKAGLFQKLGGWSKYFPLAVTGEGKALHAWQDLNAVKRLAVATTTEINVIVNSAIQNISPQEFISDVAPDFSTTNTDATVEIVDTNIANVTPFDAVEFLTPVSVGGVILSGIYPIATITGTDSYTIEARMDATATVANGGAVPVFDTTIDSAEISVTLEDHAQVVGNIVVFPLATSVGGLTVQGKYTVTTITSVDIFTITATEAATSTDTQAMNGGDVEFRYLLVQTAAAGGLGYGLGDYGEGSYGLGGSVGTTMVGDPIDATDWTLDNWGEILLAGAENDLIFYWGPDSGFTNMQPLIDGPAKNTGMFVSQSQQQIIAYGSSLNAWDPVNQLSGVPGIGIYQDPLLIQWCDLSNFFDWVATITNQAGNFRIPNGSLIVGGYASKNRNLFWTDLELWAGSFIAGQFVYSHNKIGSNCGLIGKHAWAAQNDSTYWLGKSNFYLYAGAGVIPLPCTVWDEVFQDINFEHAHKSVAASNSDFTEIWWFWPTISGGNTYPDKYCKYNIIEGTWETGPLSRLAWIDRSVIGNPVAIDNNGIIFKHEDGYDDDTQAMNPRFRTGFFYLTEGHDLVTIDQFIPDFKYGTESGDKDAQILITLYYVDYPSDTLIENGPYLVNNASQFVTLDPPFTARQVMVDVQSQDVGSFWRQGLLRFRYSMAGQIMGVDTSVM